MSVYYEVCGQITMSKDVFEKEKEDILKELLEWESSDMEGSLTVEENDSSGNVTFDFEDDQSHNYYRDIAEVLIDTLYDLKLIYPEDIKGEVFITSTDGDYYAAKIKLDYQYPEYSVLSKKNKQISPKNKHKLKSKVGGTITYRENIDDGYIIKNIN